MTTTTHTPTTIDRTKLPSWFDAVVDDAGFDMAVLILHCYENYPTWTPTADLAALPPFDTYVIVHSRSGVTSLMHRSRHGRGGWAWREHFKTWAQSEITHWMPKPEAPEAVKEVTP